MCGGKSYKGRLIAKYIACKVAVVCGVDNIHFDTESYIKFAELSPKYTINLLDESKQALNKRRGMSKSNVKFNNWISENRDKQQFHIIILPAIHDLESYISIWRMKLLIHALLGHVKNDKYPSGYKLLRGYFKVYENGKELQKVLFNKAKYGYYSYPKYEKYARKIHFKEVFTDAELKAYKDKKAKCRSEKYVEDEKKEENKYMKLIVKLNREGKMTQEEISNELGLSHGRVGQMIREYELKAKK